VSEFHEHPPYIHEVAPGETCQTCKRRVPHPKKKDSPQSEVDSFRVPPGEKDNSRAVEEVASEHAGISTAEKFWRWKYRVALDAWVLQQQPGFLARAMERGDA
jgi:hypothetical protein